MNLHNYLRHLLLTICIWCCLSASAQHPYFYTIHDESGLPSNEVYQLQQDDFGYMWIGCNAGLFRYDGFKFQPFKNLQQNSIAISGLTLSAGKRLYSQNFSGQIFYTDHDSLMLVADVKERTRAHPPFTIGKENDVWIGLPEGLLKQNAAGKQTLYFKDELKLIELECCDDGSLYAIDITKGLLKIVHDGNGSYKWTKIQGATKAFTASRTTIKKQGNRFFALTATNVDQNYFITELRKDTAILIKAIPKNTIAEFIYSISLIDEKLWLGTSSGAFCLTTAGVIENNYFPTEKISDIICDREHSYWFSSLQNGIFVIPNLNLTAINSSNSPLKDNNITALKGISSTDILMGTYSGDLYRYSILNKQLEQLPKSSNTNYRNVTSIIPYSENIIIAARGAISVIDLKTKKDHSHASFYIRDMVQTGDSCILVSSENIGSINSIAKLVTENEYSPKNLKRISGKKICRDIKSGLTWITLNEGLATFEHNELTPFTINNAPVFCNVLYADGTGLWAGTISDGVYNILHKRTRLHLNETNGLKGSNVLAIISQHDTLYVATNLCINIRYPNKQFEYIDYTDGINAKEITSLCITGRHILIGTIRGLFDIPVNNSFTNKYRPDIALTSVSADGVARPATELLELKWNSKDILIRFSSVALRSRGKFAYIYRIKGFQNEWKKLDGSINYVSLNHLPPGNFTFEVKAANEDGITSKNTAVLAIAVRSPFWQQWWFFVIITATFSSVVALLFIMRIRKIKHNAHIRNQITTSQLTALKAQMNPHFMYNTLNSIQDLILQNDIKNTNYYLSRYSTLMRKILESSESSEIELNEEIEILRLYMELEKLRFGDEFTYTIVTPEKSQMEGLTIPSMIIQPFVENAIKHGLLHKRGLKKLDLVFAYANHTLSCLIRDNGIGRDKAAEIKKRSPIGHKSFATKATERRLELININRKEKIKLTISDLHENSTATGTEVRLDIPLTG